MTRRSTFSAKQIIAILRGRNLVHPVTEACDLHGISDTTQTEVEALPM